MRAANVINNIISESANFLTLLLVVIHDHFIHGIKYKKIRAYLRHDQSLKEVEQPYKINYMSERNVLRLL